MHADLRGTCLSLDSHNIHYPPPLTPLHHRLISPPNLSCHLRKKGGWRVILHNGALGIICIRYTLYMCTSVQPPFGVGSILGTLFAVVCVHFDHGCLPLSSMDKFSKPPVVTQPPSDQLDNVRHLTNMRMLNGGMEGSFNAP